MVSRMSSYRFFTTEQNGGVTIVSPVDPYLQGTALAELLRHELLQIVDTTGSESVVVDFRNVKLISSSVVSSLLGVKRHLKAANTPFLLCGMSDSLRHVFRTLNLDGTILTIVDSVEQALDANNDFKGKVVFRRVRPLEPSRRRVGLVARR